jgi:DNA-binding helix-hairpin-helix protein with protein kinase domain
MTTMRKVLVKGQEVLLRQDRNTKSGKEGSVFSDPTDADYLIKIPHVPKDIWREKLKVLLADPISSPDIAWPVEPVYALDGTTVVGCRLPLAANKYELSALYTIEPKNRWIEATYAFRLQVAINLMAAAHKVHQHGCVIGDLSPKNVLVGKDSAVCLIDVDSFQITRDGRTHRCEDRTVYHDAFGLACFVFELLVGPGIHPFATHYTGKGTSLSLPERVRQGIWPYAQKPHPDYQHLTAGPLDLLHPLIQRLVIRCFQDGHIDPHARPLPDEWLVALNECQRDVAFINVVAPRREAVAQARQRQVLLAANAMPAQHAAMPWQVASPLPSLPRRWSRRTVLTVAVCISLLATGWFGNYLIGNSLARAWRKWNTGYPTPALYQALSPQDRRQPYTPAHSRATPDLYKAISHERP